MKFFASSIFRSTEESVIYNRVATRLIPFLLLLYVISFLDRVNVGFAKLHMSSAIGLSDVAYGTGAGIFFIGYALCEIPSNLLLQRFGARLWITRIMVVWGLISTCMAFVRTPDQFLTLRFLLGVAEAGFYPGIVLYLTYWFPLKLRSQVCALFFVGIPLAGIIGGPITGWIMKSMGGVGGMADWQWLFVMEGIPAVIGGIATYLYLSDGPNQASWLAPAERSLIADTLAREDAQRRAEGCSHRFADALVDRHVWILTLINFTLLSAIYGMSFWLPQIVKDLGVKDMFLNGLTTVIPSALAAVAMIAIGRSSDRRNERVGHIAVPGLVTAAAFVGAAQCMGHPALALGLLSIAMAGALASITVLWAVPGALLSGTAAAAGLALMATVGNLGGYFAPTILGVAKRMTHSVDSGLYVLAGVVLIGMLLTLLIPRSAIARLSDVASPGKAPIYSGARAASSPDADRSAS